MPLPRLLTAPFRLFKALFKASRAWYEGLDAVMEKDSPLVEARLRRCACCKQKKTLAGHEFCGECSCLLNAKTRLRTESCPLNKW